MTDASWVSAPNFGASTPKRPAPWWYLDSPVRCNLHVRSSRWLIDKTYVRTFGYQLHTSASTMGTLMPGHVRTFRLGQKNVKSCTHVTIAEWTISHEQPGRLAA